MSGCVYVIESSDGYSKVGVSNDPESRLRSLQTSTPHRLTMAHAIECEDEISAYDVERLAHSYLKLFRIGGEWFNAPRQFILASVDRAWAEIKHKERLFRWRRRYRLDKNAMPWRVQWFSLMDADTMRQ